MFTYTQIMISNVDSDSVDGNIVLNMRLVLQDPNTVGCRQNESWRNQDSSTEPFVGKDCYLKLTSKDN